MQQWSEFHEAIERLPDNEREVFELLWYHELPQEEVANLVGLSVRQVKRIWRAAKLRLHDELRGAD
jgi:RNA polymerase sigma-70 factor (ECF subfamily)